MRIDPEQYRKTFFDEAADHLVAFEGALLRLDGGAHDPAAVDELFRAVHTLKGGADVVGLTPVARFAHSLETLLERFRGTGPMPRAVLDILLEATDLLARLLESARGNEPVAPEVEAAIARLTAAAAGCRASDSASDNPTFAIVIQPHVEALRSGIDPLLLIRDLGHLGRLTKIQLHKHALPALEELNPERCYLSWSVHLQTGADHAAVADVFSFAPDMVRVHVEQLRSRPGLAKALSLMAGAVRESGEHPPGADMGGPGAPDPRANASLHMSRVESMVRKLPVPDPVRFAAFLVERGTVTAEQALAALVRQRDSRPLIGPLAVKCGRMSVDHLFATLAEMRDGDGFGPVAVKLGYLSEDDLGRLFMDQERNTPSIGDCLVASGAAAHEIVARELVAFRSAASASPDVAKSYCELPEPELPPSPGASMLDENGAMVGEFCGEADEHLEAADRHLLTIDGDPTNAEALNAVYRGFHTIKGVSSMLNLGAVQVLAHEAENLLNLARDGKVVLRGKPLDLVFASTDALKRQIAAVRTWAFERGKLEQDAGLPKLLAELRAAVSGKEVPTPAAEPEPKPVPAPAKAPEPKFAATAPEPNSAAVSPAVPAPTSPVAVEAPVAPRPEPRPEPHPEAGPAARRGASADKETVRVDKDRLDKLINTIGELVIAQSMAQQEFDELTVGSGELSLALPELSKISRDLQELSLSLRMVPLQGTFQKMHRLVRDLSRKMNKPVELDLIGEETELDKTVVDQLGDPLMHMVRNAVDHGLESPTDRLAVGKPAEGRVTLKAFHQGGNVYIELADDGKGLDKDRIYRKAIEKGLIAEGTRLTDAETYALIFAPGFSTAAAVTDVSGRGVGMDVVRRNVEALQGSILIRTVQGKGTTFTIRLPLTLAIMDGLMVGLGGDVYVLPLLSVVESFRPKSNELHTVAARGEAVTVRGEVVPLLRLYQLLGRPGEVTDPCRGLVVLVEDQGKKHALLVDELLGQMQAVVKSLDANYRRVEGLAGATILGDGRVAMILDIHGLTRLHGQCGGGLEPAMMADIPLGELT